MFIFLIKTIIFYFTILVHKSVNGLNIENIILKITNTLNFRILIFKTHNNFSFNFQIILYET